MAIAVNTKAPLFTLKRRKDGGFEEISLADNLGKKTVLLFVPAAFSSICQDELCSISAGLDQYAELGAEVWGISVDNPFALEAWENIANIGFPLLSDWNREVIHAYDVATDDFIGYKDVAKRSAFVIDEEGTVIYSWSSDDARVLPPFDELKAVL
ncbi:MAG: redoxin domain-containing protein [Puniceicoccaceae bacterium]